MKLELKHICAYLPYGIDAEHKDTSTIDKIDYICHKTGHIGRVEEYPNEWEDTVICDTFENYKPLLRPMSDLIKPITHNGKTFVPAQVLWSVEIGAEEAFETYGTIPEYWKTCCELELKHHAWGDVQKLLKWHFDIFKLIPNGLAIAIK